MDRVLNSSLLRPPHQDDDTPIFILWLPRTSRVLLLLLLGFHFIIIYRDLFSFIYIHLYICVCIYNESFCERHFFGFCCFPFFTSFRVFRSFFILLYPSRFYGTVETLPKGWLNEKRVWKKRGANHLALAYIELSDLLDPTKTFNSSADLSLLFIRRI